MVYRSVGLRCWEETISTTKFEAASTCCRTSSGLTSESPEVTASLWGSARFAYLDSPLPSLFKERLFVYLSRFCQVRYCISRHVGFLIGLGHPAGDAQSPIQTTGEIVRLLRRALPRDDEVSRMRRAASPASSRWPRCRRPTR